MRKQTEFQDLKAKNINTGMDLRLQGKHGGLKLFYSELKLRNHG